MAISFLKINGFRVERGTLVQIPQLSSTSEPFVVPKFSNIQEARPRVIDAGFIVEGQTPILLNYMKKFLGGPLVFDILENHADERRPWRNAQSDEAALFLKKNRLTLNSICGVASILETLFFLEDEGEEIGLSIDPDLRKRAKDFIAKIDEYKSRVISVKISYQTIDGQEVVVGTKKVSDQEARQFEAARKAEEKKYNEMIEKREITTIPTKDRWDEIRMVDDPDRDYDPVPLLKKQILTDEATAIAITLFQQNGFTIRKRLFEDLNSS